MNGADYYLQRHLVTDRLLQLAAVWRSLQSPISCRVQRAQNNAARAICQQRTCVHARPLSQSLHWLPIKQRIQYIITVITHKALSISVPPYIDELLQRQVTTRSLRSTDAPRLSVPWTRTETAKRAFCMAAPNVWNSLPNDISSLSTFRAKLKTHFLLMHTRGDIPTAAPPC